jgi:hypothetical protein
MEVILEQCYLNIVQRIRIVFIQYKSRLYDSLSQQKVKEVRHYNIQKPPKNNIKSNILLPVPEVENQLVFVFFV